MPGKREREYQTVNGREHPRHKAGDSPGVLSLVGAREW